MHIHSISYTTRPGARDAGAGLGLRLMRFYIVLNALILDCCMLAPASWQCPGKTNRQDWHQRQSQPQQGPPPVRSGQWQCPPHRTVGAQAQTHHKRATGTAPRSRCLAQYSMHPTSPPLSVLSECSESDRTCTRGTRKTAKSIVQREIACGSDCWHHATNDRPDSYARDATHTPMSGR